jgi:hypothetical protein
LALTAEGGVSYRLDGGKRVYEGMDLQMKFLSYFRKIRNSYCRSNR